MKILIINQHTSNHGDEAAGKALYRALAKAKPDSTVSVMYNSFLTLKKTEFLNDFKEVKQFHSGSIDWFKRNNKKHLIRFLAFKLIPLFAIVPSRFFRIRISFRDLARDIKIIKRNDIIISAPSGPNLGEFYCDWSYLWKIYAAVRMNKLVIIYSPSIGRLENKSYFNRKAIECLSKVKFISIRDSISESTLNKLGIDYHSSIDTAFLDNYQLIKLPIELQFIDLINYIVIVPNQLYNHIPGYQNINPAYLDSLYVNIIKSFDIYSISIVLLPQLFGVQNDFDYFTRLISELPDSFKSRIYLISENYNSDIQQLIISKSHFVIGARYHSIVFSIRSKVPFICLSYEHKMVGMLEKLNLSRYNIDISDYINKKITNEHVIHKIRNIYEERQNKEIVKASKLAKEIASHTFIKLNKIFN